MFRNFIRDRRGNFAIMTALAAVPLFASMGLAIDYSRGVSAKNDLQDRADEAALSVARQGPAGTDRSILNNIHAELAMDSGLVDLDVNARWTTVNEFTVDLTGELPLTLMRVLPSVGDSLTVNATSVARYKEAIQKPKVPELASLDPEAGDYNRIYAYCYNKEKKDDILTKGRSNFVAISDNGGTKHKDPMPTCSGGETISYQLYNVRDSRGNKHDWDNPVRERYSYFTDTDTNKDTGAETYNLGPWAILETVLCANLQECKPVTEGGVIPVGRHRTPQRATETCAPGKFMYFGWEDRPPGRGYSDEDYDDIRLIVSCPEWEIVGEDVVRLVR